MHWKSMIWGFLGGVLAFFAPLKVIFIVLLGVVLCDCFTGIWASLAKKVPITSTKLRRTVNKLLGYITAITLFYAIEVGLGFDFNAYKIVAGFICVVELISILENLATATNLPVFTSIIDLLKGNIKKKLGDVADDIFKNGEQ